MSGDWDLASFLPGDDLLSPPRDDAVDLHIWPNHKIKVHARVRQALEHMLEERWHPECRTKTALTRLAMRNLIEQFAEESKDPEHCQQAANLTALIDAEDLPQFITADQRLLERLEEMNRECRSAHQRVLILRWARMTLPVMEDEFYVGKFSKAVKNLEQQQFGQLRLA